MTEDYSQLDVKGRVIAHFKDFFKGRVMGETEMVKKVLPSFPTSPQLLPCLMVSYTGDSMEGGSIGYDFGAAMDEFGNLASFEGAYFRESLEIRYFCQNAELRDLVRPFLRAAIFAMFRPFDEVGIILPQVSGGQDEQDYSSEAPQELYMIPYTVSFKVPIVNTAIWYEKALGVDASFSLTTPIAVDLTFVDRVQRLVGAQ